MFGISTTELIIIVLVILLLFGGKKIPELMRGLGQGVRSFKQGLNEAKADLDPDPAPNSKTAPAGDEAHADTKDNQKDEVGK